MLQVKKLIQRIDRGLEDDADPISLRNDAADYADYCKTANERLDQCEVLIEEGKEHDAISLAEIRPPLIEIAGILEFDRVDEWRDHCRENNLPVPDRISREAAVRLNGLYSKISDSDHKLKDELLKTFRSAILERRDDDALTTIRTLAKLFPKEGAVAQLPDIEDKVLTADLKILGRLIADGDETGATRLLGEIELKFPDVSPSEEAWGEAISIRQRLSEEAAAADCSSLLSEAAQCREEKRWEAAFEILGKISRLQHEWGVQLAPEDQITFEDIHAWTEQERERASQDQHFEACNNALLEHIETVSAKRHRSTPTKLPEFIEDRTRLSKLWEDLKRCQRPVADDVTNSLKKCAGTLNSEITRRQRIKKNILVFSSILALAFGGIAATYTILMLKARELAADLDRFQKSGEFQASKNLLAKVETGNGLVRRFSTLNSATENAAAWQSSQLALADAFSARTKELGEMAASGFTETDATTATGVAGKFQEAADMRNELSDDLGVEDAEVLANAQAVWNTRTSEIRAANIDSFKEIHQEIQNELREIAGLNLMSSEAGERTSALAPRVAEIEAIAYPTVGDLKLPGIYQELVAETKAKLTKLQGNTSLWREVEAELRSSSTLPQYQNALARLVDEFDNPDANAAKSTITTKEEFTQQVLMPGDKPAWDRFSANGYKPNLHPDSTAEIPAGDRSILRRLRDSENLADVYLYASGDPKNTDNLPIYSRGKIADEAEKVDKGVKSLFQQGSIYIPWNNPDSLNFKDTEWNFNRVGENTIGDTPLEPKGISPESAALASIDLPSYYDSKIEHYSPRSLTKALDAIIANKDINLLFKAFVHRELATLMTYQAEEWGIEWTSVGDHLRRLNAIIQSVTFDDSSWMIPERNKQLLEPLGKFYQEIEDWSYFSQIETVPRILEIAALSGFNFAGFVSSDGKLAVKKDIPEGKDLWGYSRSRKPAILFGADRQPQDSPLPFTPLFYFTNNPDKIVKDVNRFSGGAAGLTPITSKLPALFHKSS